MIKHYIRLGYLLPKLHGKSHQLVPIATAVVLKFYKGMVVK